MLAGDGSYSEACLVFDAEASLSNEGTAVLGNRLAASSAGLLGVAGNCDIGFSIMESLVDEKTEGKVKDCQ